MLRNRFQSAKWFFLRLVRRIFPMRWRKVGRREPILMILLLRKLHEFSEEEIRRAAEAAWALSFSGIEGSTRLVSSRDDAVFLQAGPHRLSFHSRPRPYENNPEK